MEQPRAGVCVGLNVYRSNDAHLVDDAGELREQLADFDAVASVTLELERRRHHPAALGPRSTALDAGRHI
jgi:hypothetical protein